MTAFQSCSDTLDAVELFPPQNLYLKPVARFNISVQFPQMKRAGQAISHLEIMEKLRGIIEPEKFTFLKVSKSTLEFVRFEAEIESRSRLPTVMVALSCKVIRLSGFNDSLKIRVAEAKSSVPTRHSWDSFFHNAKNMNERKPGERPDTLYITNVPCKWFVSRHDKNRGIDKPSEYILKKVFEVFGEIRYVDIPCVDSYRNKMKGCVSGSGIKTFSFGQDEIFDCYVQYKDYISFVKAMDALRGMKLLYKDGDVAYTASIKVDFDRTKHLSDVSIQLRDAEREKIKAEEKNMEEYLRKEAEKESEKASKIAQQQQQGIADRKVTRVLKKFKKKCKKDINFKIVVEERKLLMAQRKLESIRLLDVILERVKKKRQSELEKKKRKKELKKKQQKEASDEQEKALRKRQAEVIAKRLKLEAEEQEIRQKIIMKYKAEQKEEMKQKKEELKAAIDGKQKDLEDLTNEHLSDSDLSVLADSSSKEKQTGPKISHESKSCCSMQYDCHEFCHQHFTQRFSRRRGFFCRRPNFYRNRRSRGRGFHFPYKYQSHDPYYSDHSWINMEYYRYFKKLANIDGESHGTKSDHSSNNSDSFTMSPSVSKHSRSYSRSHSRSRGTKYRSSHRSRSASYSRQRSRKSRSRKRNYSRSSYSCSRSHSRHRSHHRRSYSRLRSYSRRSYSRGRRNSRRSHSHSRSRSRSRRNSRRSRTRSRSHSKSRRNSRRSHSNSRSHSKSRRNSTRSHSHSRSYSRSRRSSRGSNSHSRRHSHSYSKNSVRISRSCSRNRSHNDSRQSHSHSRSNSRRSFTPSRPCSRKSNPPSNSPKRSSSQSKPHFSKISNELENPKDMQVCTKNGSVSQLSLERESNLKSEIQDYSVQSEEKNIEIGAKVDDINRNETSNKNKETTKSSLKKHKKHKHSKNKKDIEKRKLQKKDR